MAKKIKHSAVIAAIGVLIYLVSVGGVSQAGIGSAGIAEMSAGAVISLEACIVRVEIAALERSTGGSGFFALSSIPAEQIIRRVEAGEAEVVSGVTLLVSEGSVGEISTEQNNREKEKDHEKKTGGHSGREKAVSLRADVIEICDGRIVLEFDFKQVISEHGASGSTESEREEESAGVFDVCSTIVLPAGRPTIAGSKKGDGAAMFLILYATM